MKKEKEQKNNPTSLKLRGTSEKLVLLDAHAIIHRAYHALPDFATSSGEPTGALYGLVLMVLKIATDLKPDYIVACYDLPKPTYRHEVYEGYKAGRAKTDDELSVQLEKSKQICEALNIPIYSKEGFEADDMLGTIVEKMRNNGLDIIIASGDMDTMQLVDDAKGRSGSVKVYTLKKGIKETILYDEKAVEERFGFEPELLADFKGLRGDPSDNIIGIAGVGEKSATDLIKNFGSIENIYKTLKKDPKKLEEKGIRKGIIELLKNGEEEAKFSKMLATIRRDAPIDFILPEQKWKEGLDFKKAETLFGQLEFRNMGERLRTVLNKKTSPLTPLPSPASRGRVGDEVKDLEELKVALWVVDSNKTNPDLEDISNFAGTDNFEKAKEIILAELKKRESGSVFEEIEKPLIPIIKKMEKRGVVIDTDFLQKLNKDYSRTLGEIKKKVWKEAGVEFNISSPKQLGEILFNKLNLSVKYQKKTSTGAKSTKESELQKMKDLHPIIPMILEYRELSKLVSTYIEPIPKMVDKEGRLHAHFIQTGTTTGRMASSNPNLQNIPVSSDKGMVIRKAFLAPKGFSLVAFDYSQIELRIAAFLSSEEKFIKIFKSGEDVHESVASYVFNVPKEEVTKEMRRRAKIINFGILYGMGVNALAQNLGSDRKIAQEFYNAYFEKFHGLARYLDRTKEEANKLGYTKTFFGRRRYFEGIKSKIPFIRASAERMAINAPIQGTSADIIKIAMKRVDDFLKENKLEEKVHLILQIHDELIYEITEDLVTEITPKIRKIMQDIISPDKISGIPIIVNSVFGKNWGEMS
ncbi:MAG: DNA polymerase [Candidatus Zambryskibacteria bacterium]